MANILITGASGFIGSFMTEEALSRNMSVWAGIRQSSSKRYLSDQKIRFIELDFAHPDILRQQLSSHKAVNGAFDYIIHCAGATKCVDKKGFEDTNYLQTKHFVNALIELDMIPLQFVFISTLSIFGPIHEKDYTSIKEDDIPAPNTLYGISKLKAEQYIQNLPNFPYVFYRPTGVYGARDKDYFLMAKSVKRHIDFSAGYKRQDITFIYVKDLVKAVFLGIDKNVSRRAYLVSDGKTYQSHAFSNLIKTELGISFLIRLRCPLPVLKMVSLFSGFFAGLANRNSSTLNSDKYNILKQRNWQCDITPVMQELGFTPDYTLEKGVKEAVAWYKNEGWL
ncbi:UDP-glucose 4-epimerase [termite gut metagenome]|uniref:UDP-glucose 4-epimerase n=1 Tax=termite gut metagenome TaxID=433724 RepID=A0A5J4T205_9ZZZZ